MSANPARKFDVYRSFFRTKLMITKYIISYINIIICILIIYQIVILTFMHKFFDYFRYYIRNCLKFVIEVLLTSIW